MITIWDNPEWRVLFDVTRLERVKPWQVKLAEIIESLMKELKNIGMIDFHSCGVAAYSAAIIHRMKTERLLKFDIPRTPKERPNMTLPPPVNLPLIPDFMITTMNELIEALQNLLARSRREKVKEETRKETSGVDNLLAFLGNCIDCHNCKDQCPICFCKECFWESPTFEFQSSDYMDWANKRGGVRLPTDTLFFHLGRLAHMSSSCTGCGLCEDACPREIELQRLFKMVGENVQKAFDYEPGRDIEDRPPLTTFKEEELLELGE